MNPKHSSHVDSWLNSHLADLWTLTSLWVESPDEIQNEVTWLLKKTIDRLPSKETKDLWELNRIFWTLTLKQLAHLENSRNKILELQCVLIFSFHWPLKKSAEVTGKSESIFRYEILDNLRDLAGWDPHQESPPSRVCLNTELHFIDFLLNQNWTDPLGHFRQLDFKEHLQNCHRCQKQKDLLESAVTRFELKSSMDKERKSQILADVKDSSRPRLLLKPKMILGAALAILAIIYIQDIPALKDLIKQKPQPKSKPFFSETQPGNTPLADAEVPPPPPAPIPTPTVAVVAEVKVEKKAEQAQITQVNKKAKQSFQVWDATTEEIDASASKVLSLLMNFGASKAADLELGAWNRGGRYYHFNVDQDRFADLVVEFEKLGLRSFKRYDSSSARKTPEGKMRVVLLLVSKKAPKTNASPSKDNLETPPESLSSELPSTEAQ